MTVYVWKDGKYVGQVIHRHFDQIDVLADDQEQREKLKELLLSAKTFGPNHNFDLMSGEIRKSYEFATEEWLDMAALLVLPRAGYRVHIIQNPGPDPYG